MGKQAKRLKGMAGRFAEKQPTSELLDPNSIDPSHVVIANSETGEPILVMDPKSGKIQWDERYLSREVAMNAISEVLAEMEVTVHDQIKSFETSVKQ